MDANRVDAVNLGPTLGLPTFCHLCQEETQALILTDTCEAFLLDIDKREVTQVAGVNREAPWLEASDFKANPDTLCMANSNWIEVYALSLDTEEIFMKRHHEYPIGNTTNAPAESVHVAFMEHKPNSVLYGNTVISEFLVVDYGNSQALSIVKFGSPLSRFHVSRDKSIALFATRESTFMLEMGAGGTVSVDTMKLKRHTAHEVGALAAGKITAHKVQIIYGFDKNVVFF